MLVYIFTNASARAGRDTWLIFKPNFTGLNSELSIPQTGRYTKVKVSSLPYYLSFAEGTIIRF